MKKIQKISLLSILIILIFIINPMITVYAIDLTTYNQKIPDHHPEQYTSSDSPILTDIRGGIGLTLTMKNKGNEDISDISIDINSTGGFIVHLPQNHYEIPFIAVNDTTEIHIKLYGLGLGILLNNPKINITISGHTIRTTEITIIARIFGFLIQKINEYSNVTGSDSEFTLFAPTVSTTIYLINMSGEIVHTWNTNHFPRMSAYLLEDGNILRPTVIFANPIFLSPGAGGTVQKLNWNGTVIWTYDYSTDQHCLHHDVEILPNGNVLLIAWEYKTKDEAISAGRNPATIPHNELWPDHIIEVHPTGPTSGEIVWEWHVWDHLVQDFDPTKDNYGVVAEHPELIDINYATSYIDLLHTNSIDYNEEYDQIMLSIRNFNEIWIIDHSTTTAEAAGHTGGNNGMGGDILYRWGNPHAYQKGTINDQQLYEQHDATWIASGHPGEGNILVFNNGEGRPTGLYSSVDEIIPPVNNTGHYYQAPGLAYGPENLTWSYTASIPTNFHAHGQSGAQRLKSGNTLICNGPKGKFFEVTPEKYTIWEYLNPYPTPALNHLFTIQRYSSDYPGLQQLFN